MKKQSALAYIRMKRRFVPYSNLFDIYTDDDIIPDELIIISCTVEPESSRVIMCGTHLATALNKLPMFNQ